MAKEKRFVKLYEESIGLMGAAYILVDTQTGVHYLVAQNGTIGGLTPLLDAEGRPVITLADVEEKDEDFQSENLDSYFLLILHPSVQTNHCSIPFECLLSKKWNTSKGLPLL